jgi:hypothetical protein
MVWNPFKGGKYDLSKTVLSALPGGDPIGVYTHSNDAPQVSDNYSNDLFETMADKPEWAKLGFASEADYLAAVSNNITGGTSSTGGASSTPESNIDVIDGVSYNLNDPGQFQAYIQAANAKLDSAFDYFRTSAESTRDEDIAEAKAQEERVLQNISRAMENLSYSKESYDKDYTRSLSDLAEGFRQGTARRQTFYASVAPRVYQSSQGTSQAYGENKYKEGQTRYAEDKEKTYRDFNQAEQEYKQSQQDTSNQFNLYKQRRERQAQDAIFNQAQQTQGQRDAMMGKTKNWKADQVSAGRSQWSNVPEFQARDLSGYTPSNVGLNDLMQFIKFQPAGVGTTTSTGRSQVMATPEAGGQSLSSYIGYQPEQEEENTLNLYKTGQGY